MSQEARGTHPPYSDNSDGVEGDHVPADDQVSLHGGDNDDGLQK